MIIKPDLHDRYRPAASEALDQGNSEFAVLGRFAGVSAEPTADMIGYLRLAHDLA